MQHHSSNAATNVLILRLFERTPIESTRVENLYRQLFQLRGRKSSGTQHCLPTTKAMDI